MSDPFELSDDTPEATPISVAARAGGGEPPYLKGLNESQRQAVETTEGPLLMLAGAGTGKTRALTTRLGHILLQGKARPWDVLAVTFTNKAAREMQRRVGDLLGTPVEGWWVGTFHALGARILRKHAEAVGLKSNFTILDADDQTRLVKQLLAAEDIDEKRWPARVVLGVIQRWKDRGLTPDKVSDAEGSEVADGHALKLYQQYQDRLVTLNAADFGDLLLLCLKLFQEQPEILKTYQDKFRYILVDEYQDTNVAQYLWLRLLAMGHQNICCVGDDDQSIYSWRGAEIGNILRFEEDFPGAAVVRLERNYRSTTHILGAASGLIAHNEGRLGKTLWTDDDDGGKVRVRGVWDGEEEARVVGDEIEAMHTKGHKLNEIAVLVRAGFQTREFEERLMTLAIPYRVVGGARFYERLEIRDAIAYMRVTVQPDDDLALERIINTPRRGIGKATLQTIHVIARAENISLFTAIRKLIETDEFKPKARNALTGVIREFDRWRGAIETMPHEELVAMVLEESGYTDMWQRDKTPEAPGRLENLKELMVALGDYGSLVGFLEHVSLVMDTEDKIDDDMVSLMTLHGAKGLEFDTVFLPGWEEGLFPHQRSLDESGVNGLEEERRLAYVGLTRARKRADILFAANRRIYGQWQSAIPSRFVDELPIEHVETESEPGLYGGRGMGENGDANSFGDGGSSFLGGGGGRRKTPVIEDVKWRRISEVASEGTFEMGQRVFHQKFGYGLVSAIDGDKLEIKFEKAGTKKVMAGFVESV